MTAGAQAIWARLIWLLTLPVLLLALPCAARVCTGDCDGNSIVTAGEVAISINMLLGRSPVAGCPAADANGDGRVTIDEVIEIAQEFRTRECRSTPPGIATGDALIDVGGALGAPGQTVSFAVTLHTTEQVAGAQTDIAFDASTPITDCAANPAIGKDVTIELLPSGCQAGTDCTGVRVLVLSVIDLSPIPDGATLYTCNIGIAPGASEDVRVLAIANVGAATPEGDTLPASGLNGAVVVTTTSPVCGNGVAEADEQCDDANLVGGDGCAANCTTEDARLFVFGPPTSGATVQSVFGFSALPLSGHAMVVTGQPRPTDDSGTLPSVIRARDTVFDPMPLEGIGCVCVRAVESPALGPGNSGRGSIGCGGAGMADLDYLVSIDHNTDDVDPNCDHGVREGPGARHPGVCNGMPTFSFSGRGPRGSELITNLTSVSIILDGGTCSTTDGDPIKGADGIPCTDDDLAAQVLVTQYLTTGTAAVQILDADNTPGAVVGPGASCGGLPCIAETSGSPLDCDALLTDRSGGLDTGDAAVALPLLDALDIVDVVMSARLAGPLTPTATPTITSTPAPTPTMTPATAPASLVLRRARLRAETRTGSLRRRGALFAQGIVNANSPFGSLLEDILTTGARMTVTAGNANVPLSWSAADCAVQSTRRATRLVCDVSDVQGQRTLTLRSTGTPNLLTLQIAARQLDLQAPLSSGPVAVELATTSFTRQDDIDRCTVRGPQSQLVDCRETGITAPGAQS